MTNTSNRAWHQTEADRLREDYAEATHALALQVQHQVEQAGG